MKKDTIETKPYVVSADVNLLMRSWATKNKYQIPDKQYFQDMTKDLKNILSLYFDSVQVVPEEFLSSGMTTMANKVNMPIITLDRAYIGKGIKGLSGFIDITRSVDENLNDKGISERPGTPTIKEQLDYVIKDLNSNKVALLDDVLFEGGTHTMVSKWLKQRGITVEKVLVGISIKEGAQKLAQNGIDVHSLLSYDNVMDEVCERDFVAGVPLSGRTVVTGSGEIYGAPYFSPFGKPEQWASIPKENAVEFSDFCLAQTIMLWHKIEKMSKTTIPTQAVPKVIFGLTQDKSITIALKKEQRKRK